MTLDALRQLQPGQARHFDIGDQYIGLQPLQFAPGDFAIGGGAQHLDIRFHCQQRGQRAAHHRLVFGEQHANHAPSPARPPCDPMAAAGDAAAEKSESDGDGDDTDCTSINSFQRNKLLASGT